jgi:two-component system chemotaxis response regulator CheB
MIVGIRRTGRPRAAIDIIAIASSAGGVQAMTEVLGGLPVGFDAIVVCVQHLHPRHRSLLPEVLGRRSKLPVEQAVDGVKVERGHVYLAPPNRHLLIKRQGVVSLTRTERVNFVRPAADLLFESVASVYGKRAIAVVLTGAGMDGSMGVTAIKKRGGTVIVQDESTSEFFGMPLAAIKTGTVDFVLALEDIAPALTTLVAGEGPARPGPRPPRW